MLHKSYLASIGILTFVILITFVYCTISVFKYVNFNKVKGTAMARLGFVMYNVTPDMIESILLKRIAYSIITGITAGIMLWILW